MWIIIIISIIIFIIFYNIFVYFLWSKIDFLEENIIGIFKRRNNQVMSIYQISKNYINKSDEIFKDFFELKRKDFSENSFKTWLKDKINTYKKIHNEIDFIFKVCEKNNNLTLNSRYLYLKDSILDKSSMIWKRMEIYNRIRNEYKLYKKIANFTILWIFFK